MTSCSIIGGGIAGLVAGKLLQQFGIDVTILDKGRGIGGRMATRRISCPGYGEGVFDYGLQYITARSEAFKQWLNHWVDNGRIEVWDCASRLAEDRDLQKYRGVQSNRSIAKSLARDLNTYTSKKIVNLAWDRVKWSSSADDGSLYHSDILIMTPPLPQSIELLRSSNIPLSETTFEQLSQVSYRMCLAVLMIVSAPIQVHPSGSYWVGGDKLEWIACNHQKGISPDCYAVTLHASADFSEHHYEKDKRDMGAQELINAARKYLGESNVIDYQVHVWKYSTPINHFGEPFFSSQKSPNPPEEVGPLYIAGDAFSLPHQPASSFENAFLSGFAVATYILEREQRHQGHAHRNVALI